jgi:HAD superfamily hydrolase (TIGR01458 family)
VIDVEGLLLDLEGTVAVGGGAIPGAAGALRALRERGVPYRFATNSTGATRAELAAWLRSIGIEVEPRDVVTAPVATAAYLRGHHPGARCLLLGEGGAVPDLEGVELVDPGEPADVVVVAGADRAYTWENLNRAFRMLLEGAALVAMHRNLAWRTEDGMTLDSGAFLLGLERAGGTEATVIGKPSADFFAQAVELLGVPAGRAAMVGDDLENDVLAAQSCGLTGVLVRTGKFREEQLASSGGRPDHVIDSIADLPALLG